MQTAAMSSMPEEFQILERMLISLGLSLFLLRNVLVDCSLRLLFNVCRV